jgi:hypothetical protein
MLAFKGKLVTDETAPVSENIPMKILQKQQLMQE